MATCTDDSFSSLSLLSVDSSAKDLKTNQLVAAKKIENIFEHRSLAKRTLRELKLLRAFNHENIMSLERVMRPRSRKFNNIYLVSELLETDLACVIRSPQELTDEHCQFFIYQVLRGLKYIHSANVVHRDLVHTPSSPTVSSASHSLCVLLLLSLLDCILIYAGLARVCL